ncbi:hypothetical protein GF325_04710, partial [Candidatus Bathyarchaeota archaeon]|nr:hypothetical protein [Candidatus Bathyarchaeota archaeon]
MLGQANYMLFVIYEGIIITISVVLLVLTFLKYKEKRHSLTLLLFFIMFSWSIAIIFSWLSKIIEGFLNPSALPAGSLLAAIT